MEDDYGDMQDSEEDVQGQQSDVIMGSSDGEAERPEELVRAQP